MSNSPSWYTRNRSRSFPLRGTATAVTDQGQLLPDSIIADLALRFTGETNEVAFIRSLVVSKQSVSIVINVGSTSIASATMPVADVNNWAPKQLTALVAGVQGYVVFGESTLQGNWTFSSAAQSGLTWKVAAPQPAADAPARFKRSGFGDMVGPTVILEGTGDIDISSEQLYLDGATREAIVISLSDDAENNPLSDYVGSCGKRPEANTCGSPEPIIALSGVQPDCCGRIFLEFRGCVDLHKLEGTCGVVIDCNTQAGDLCPAKELTLPTEDGILPEDSGGEETTTEAPEDEDCLEVEEPTDNTQEF